MVVSNSLKQLTRTPVKTIFFLILLILTVAFFMLGFNLWVIAGKNIENIENTFTTIGTVQQKATGVRMRESWDSGTKSYTYSSHSTYDRIIPPSVLDFEGANYILKPEKRPYYVAYSPDYVVDENPDAGLMLDFQTLIAEVQPLEDCQTDHPVRMKVKRILSGRLDYTDEILFCDHFNDQTNTLYASKTYIMILQEWPPHEDTDEYEYRPAGYPYSSQYTKDGTRIKDLAGSETTWDEVTENFYETPIGKRWLALIESYEIMKHTIPVTPTQDTNLLMAFYDGNAWISEGRDLSSEEHQSGEKVCLISNYFAKNNNLNLGDSLRLPLLCADYYSSPAQRYRYDAFFGYPGSLINANGEIYPVFEDSNYKIVGIYDAVKGASSSPDYMLGKNAVVIPSASVKNSDENNILGFGSMMGYTTSFQIPNGTADEYLAAWAKQGIPELEINFYDKGYSKLKAGLDAMAATAIILLTAGGVTTILMLMLFCHLFITKQRKRTAIERSLGMTKKQCMASLLVGILVIVIPACIIGSVVSGALSGYAFEQINASQTQDAFDTMFSDWVNSADAEMMTDVILDAQVGMEYAFVGMLFIPFALLIAFANIRSNLGREPLKLLGEKER